MGVRFEAAAGGGIIDRVDHNHLTFVQELKQFFELATAARIGHDDRSKCLPSCRRLRFQIYCAASVAGVAVIAALAFVAVMMMVLLAFLIAVIIQLIVLV